MKRLALTILGLVIVFKAIGLYRHYQESSPTPNEAVSDHIARVTSNSPSKIESIDIVSMTQASGKDSELLMLFRATERGRDSPIHMVGYATVRQSLFGWYVNNLQMFGESSLPDDILVKLDWFDESQVIYGQVFLADAASVEAIFNDITIAEEIPVGNFALFGSQYSQLSNFKILDANGNVLRQFTEDDLQNE